MLTNKGKYGLKALIHLAGQEPGQPMLASDIAERASIPKKFLDAILAQLREAGFVQARKGRGGGYALARPAHQIMVGHVIRALDGPLAPILCASQNFYRPCDDCDGQNCAVRLMMRDVRDAVARILDTRNLAELRALGEPDVEQLMYYI